MADQQILSSQQVMAEDGLEAWRAADGVVEAAWTTEDFASALELVNAIGAAAEEVDHHPDVHLSWGRVRVELTSHDVGGLTSRDVHLARTISRLAADAGAEPAGS